MRKANRVAGTDPVGRGPAAVYSAPMLGAHKGIERYGSSQRVIRGPAAPLGNPRHYLSHLGCPRGRGPSPGAAREDGRRQQRFDIQQLLVYYVS